MDFLARPQNRVAAPVGHIDEPSFTGTNQPGTVEVEAGIMPAHNVVAGYGFPKFMHIAHAAGNHRVGIGAARRPPVDRLGASRCSGQLAVDITTSPERVGENFRGMESGQCQVASNVLPSSGN